MAISTRRQPAVTDAGKKALAPRSVRPAFSKFRLPRRRAVKSGEQVFFFSQLSLMIEIGTSLTGGLHALAEQSRDPVFKEILQMMLKDLQEGKQLSDAMSRYPRVFNRVYISLVKAGEAGGFLKDTLDSIVVMLERRQALITQLRSTMTYPVILCAMALAVVIFVVVGILPKFMLLFAGKERLLPPATRFLMALSVSLRGYWWAYVTGVGALIFLGAAFWRSPFGQALKDRFLVSAPMVAPTFNKILTCQLLRTLGNLMESHVPLIEALDVTRTTFANRHFLAFVDQIREHVRGGGTLSSVFARNPYVMETVKQMVATGEEVGRLPRVMLRLAEFYDTEIQRDLKIISSLVEPAALVIIGAVVGLLVSSVILPIFRIAGTAQ
ncbi:MAG TPA: type II secretion system F family protein [Syntrophales bacterium]|nr:type II secretion system F family protein [Syntrophales bacterium]